MRPRLSRGCMALLVTAALALSGCGALSRTNARSPAPQAAMAPARGDGVYVASFVVTSVQPAGNLIAAVGFDLNSLPAGVKKIGVINRWNGAIGQHKEETRLLTPAGQVVASDGSDLTGDASNTLADPGLSQTVLDVLDVEHLLPGLYTVVVRLDDREYARYSIRFIALPGGAGHTPAGS